MMAAVPSADVVVTNPTHYSIALKYDDEEMNAPVVVAKGIDAVARRIREVAEEIDDEIDPEHYQAVAEIIGYVLRLKGKAPRAARAAAG
jgi:flagellar biosynthetic protein FlhB